MPAHAVPATPVAVSDRRNTPGSGVEQDENAPSAAQDGISVMPGSPAGQGKPSPKLQTVLVSAVLASLLLLRTSTVAGTPVFPTVTAEGKLGTALAPTPACAAAGAMPSTAVAAAAAATRILHAFPTVCSSFSPGRWSACEPIGTRRKTGVRGGVLQRPGP
jgi:hypothetical protein